MCLKPFLKVEVLQIIYAENEFKLGLAKFAKKNNGYMIH